MEFVGKINEMEIYDDFAHHPTEVESSIMSLKKKFKGKKNPLEMAEIAQQILGGQYEQQFSGGLRASFNDFTTINPASFKNAKTYCLIYDE